MTIAATVKKKVVTDNAVYHLPINEYLDRNPILDLARFSVFEVQYPEYSVESEEETFSGENCKIGRLEIFFDFRGSLSLLTSVPYSVETLGHNFPLYNLPYRHAPGYQITGGSVNVPPLTPPRIPFSNASDASLSINLESRQTTAGMDLGSLIPCRTMSRIDAQDAWGKTWHQTLDSSHAVKDPPNPVATASDWPHIMSSSIENPIAFIRFRLITVRIPYGDTLFYTEFQGEGQEKPEYQLDQTKCVAWYFSTFRGNKLWLSRFRASDAAKDPTATTTDTFGWYFPHASSRRMVTNSPYAGHFDIVDDTTIRLDKSNSFHYVYHKMFKISDFLKNPGRTYPGILQPDTSAYSRKWTYFTMYIPPFDCQVDMDINTKALLYNHPRVMYPYSPTNPTTQVTGPQFIAIMYGAAEFTTYFTDPIL